MQYKFSYTFNRIRNGRAISDVTTRPRKRNTSLPTLNAFVIACEIDAIQHRNNEISIKDVIWFVCTFVTLT